MTADSTRPASDLPRRQGLPRPGAVRGAASVPEAGAPTPRDPRRRAARIAIAALGVIAAGLAVVVTVRLLVSTPAVADFLRSYPGQYPLPDGAPVGLPWWLGWQHFLNAFLMLLVVRSGWRVRRETRPTAYWTPRRFLARRRISLFAWFHQVLDAAWLLNGLVYVVLLFATGQWIRVVPSSWDVFPNAVSAGLQYASLNWPTENGWVNYNSLQQLAYFVTVFIAAPLAALTGFRMSSLWPTRPDRMSRVLPMTWARRVHFPVMLYFVAFIVVHVALVLSTDAVRNLNHVYAAQDSASWIGLGTFAASILVMAAAWFAAQPTVIAAMARADGTVSR